METSLVLVELPGFVQIKDGTAPDSKRSPVCPANHDKDDYSIIDTLDNPHIYLDDAERTALDKDDGHPPDLAHYLA